MQQPIAAKLTYLIAALDAKIAHQLNAILHHASLQQLESAWRNLRLLATEAAASPRVKVKVLDVSLLELKRDFMKALEFDQTALFELVYQAEFGMPGGEPYGVLITDYQLNINDYADISVMTDIAALSHFAQVAAAAFVPVIANIAPASFGIEQFADLALVKDLNQLFNQPEFSRWQKFRKSDDARFMGFTLPRFLLRESYSLAHSQGTAFPFQESIHSLGDRLWGNASFAFAATLIHAFVDYGWFTDIQGLGDGFTRGGLLTHLPKAYFTVDKTRLTPKITTEFFITDTLERSLSDQGFIAFCQTHYSHYPVFYNARSAQALGAMNTSAAALNGKLVTLLPYLFCACRFAHYIKVIGRDKIGTFLTTAECERYLTNWLSAYVAGNQALANPQRAKYPLRGAKVEVKQRRGMPGSYHCVIHLQPRMQLEQVDTVFILVTELTQRLNHG